MSECALISKSYSLFPYFCSFNPYLPLEFLFLNYSSLFAFYTYRLCSMEFMFLLSIHINLSASAQNITDAYIIIMLVCRYLLTMCLEKQLFDRKIMLESSKGYLSKAIISKFTM